MRRDASKMLSERPIHALADLLDPVVGMCKPRLALSALLKAACESSGGRISLDLRMQEGYDHSYFFISSFIDEHINYHADALGV